MLWLGLRLGLWNKVLSGQEVISHILTFFKCVAIIEVFLMRFLMKAVIIKFHYRQPLFYK